MLCTHVNRDSARFQRTCCRMPPCMLDRSALLLADTAALRIMLASPLEWLWMDSFMTTQQPVAVLGGGSFGTAIANLLAENGHQVLQWMRDPEQAQAIRVNRENPRYLKGIKVRPEVEPVTDITATLEACELIFVALPSSALRAVLSPHVERLNGKMLVSLTKGIEAQSFKLMSQILEEIVPQARIGVLSGPNLARAIAEHALTATVVASEDEALCQQVQAALHGRTFRVYASNDRFGVELGGALKNVYAIIAGMAVALDMGENTKSMLITRALAEMTRFAVSQGANPMTFLGLAGVGDLIVTCSSPKSRNYQVGFALGQGLTLEEAVTRLGEVAEGVNTLKVLKVKAQEVQVYMPLVAGLHAILFEGRTLSQVIEALMRAEPKTDVDFISITGFN
ncbi:Glycerol-3-phosphate dehydrogenase [Pseudomonas amygdali pv. photiniae]|uniref:Glycerol-3-phosphate dehydrogenase [NAD(P)+] n=1 Tax=Pseudomonas amygdali pv. photiniae TaxID=251724 RepID=A0A658K143_PSEA0|nr:Glycerol-3-phosphate dehydrogenase [Pseudomonas amygdali pv. photiniae]